MTRISRFATFKHTDLDPPRRGQLPNDHDPKDTWACYPSSLESAPAHTSCVFNSYCELSRLHCEIIHALFHPTQRPSEAELEDSVRRFYKKVQKWRQDLPSCIQTEDAAGPHILCLLYVPPNPKTLTSSESCATTRVLTSLYLYQELLLNNQNPTPQPTETSRSRRRTSPLLTLIPRRNRKSHLPRIRARDRNQHRHPLPKMGHRPFSLPVNPMGIRGSVRSSRRARRPRKPQRLHRAVRRRPLVLAPLATRQGHSPHDPINRGADGGAAE